MPKTYEDLHRSAAESENSEDNGAFRFVQRFVRGSIHKGTLKRLPAQREGEGELAHVPKTINGKQCRCVVLSLQVDRALLLDAVIRYGPVIL